MNIDKNILIEDFMQKFDCVYKYKTATERDTIIELLREIAKSNEITDEEIYKANPFHHVHEENEYFAWKDGVKWALEKIKK